MTFKHTGMENRGSPLTLKDLTRTVNGHHEFKGHIVRGEATSAGFAALKNEFLDQLIANTRRFLRSYNHTLKI